GENRELLRGHAGPMQGAEPSRPGSRRGRQDAKRRRGDSSPADMGSARFCVEPSWNASRGENQFVTPAGNQDVAALLQLAAKHVLRERVLDQLLDAAFERARSQRLIEALL